jgi:predicted Zn-dependent peptidase
MDWPIFWSIWHFNGTKNFPDKGIISTLERYGVAFGRNINAYTSQNETVYNLSDVPVNIPGLIDTCLLDSARLVRFPPISKKKKLISNGV